MNTAFNKGKSVIHFEFEGLTAEETHRLRENIQLMIAQGVFNLHDGKAVIHFNYEGKVKQVDFDFTKWRETKKRAEQPPKAVSIDNIRKKLQSAMSILELVDNESVDQKADSPV